MSRRPELCANALPLAEHVAPEHAIAARKYFEARRNPDGLLRSTWNTVEYAINRNISIGPEIRAYDFEHSQSLINMILRDPKTHQDVRLGALVLSTYIPVFKKRSNDELPDSEDCQAIYESLGAAIRYLQPLSIDEPPQWRMAESAVLALSARTKQPDLLLYPTSPREENSLDGSINHDSYFMDTNGKIPIQQKLIRTDRAYDEWITILTLQPLMERGLRKCKMSDVADLSEQVNYLLSLIVAETSGERLSDDELIFLNHLSSAVASHRWKRQKAAAA